MQGKVLVIEDVKEMADLISLYLSKEGFEVQTAQSGEEGFAVMEAGSPPWQPDLVILDINLPGMDGFEFLQRFRRDRTLGTHDTPVLIVSARDSDEDQISGLGIGADEYITKPFAPKVLVARVRAVFRRFREFDNGHENLFRFGSFELDYDARTLRKNGERIPLSTKEFECLAWLIEHQGKTMDAETIYSGVWKSNYGDLATVAVHIQRLRKKIEDDPASPVYIETVRGMG